MLAKQSRYVWLAQRRTLVLSILAFTLPFIPAVIAFSLHSTTGTTGEPSLEDTAVLSAWTYLHVATIAYFVFLSGSGPPNYFAAFAFAMLANAEFMRSIGQPVGIHLAMYFSREGIADPLAATLATFFHHMLVSVITLILAWFLTEMTKQWERPTPTQRAKVPSGVTTDHGQQAGELDEGVVGG